MWDKTIILWVVRGGEKNPIKDQSPGLLIELVLVFASSADFDAGDKFVRSDAVFIDRMPNIHRQNLSR
jgi:hypothetical protein